MNSLLSALNTCTLASWLSVAGAGVAGLVIPEFVHVPEPAAEIVSVVWREPEITLAPEEEGAGGSVPETMPAAGEEAPPAPPEMPGMTEMAALPEIPDLPPVPEPPAIRTAPAEAQAAPKAGRPRTKPSITRQPAARASGGGRATAAAGGASGSGMSSASRLSAGHMPAPSYPREARRMGQTGTVVVEFTIDTSGRVISARARSASSWPLLNEEAVRTVRRWRFPPGPVMKLQRPIVFQLR